MKLSVEAPARSYRVHQQAGEVLGVQPGPPTEGPRVLRSLPAVLAEGPDSPPSPLYEEVLYPESQLPTAARQQLAELTPQETWAGSEVRTLVQQGPLENRIDLTLVGDGYTAEQKDRFFADAQRLTDDLFAQTTFHSYLPLFNVHAVYVPSREAGLSDTSSKDTALGLYRSPQGSKRGIMTGHTGAIEKALRLAPDTDFPILVANDDYYGGLGGRYAITTRSPQSGSMVLRHELGHNFGDVGEEYDGGAVYRGANHSRSGGEDWQHWADGPIVPQQATSLAAAYPWKNLNRGAVEIPLRVDGGEPARVDLKISSVGWETPQDVKVALDGQALDCQGRFTDDRSFFQLADGSQPWQPGRHTLRIEEQVKDGDNVLASVRANALAPDYDLTPGQIGAFPTFDQWGEQVGYRPTHEACLMRDMEATEFCPVDKENMWNRFLQRVTLIDDITLHNGKVTLATPTLPGLEIRWYAVDEENQTHEIEELRDQPSWAPGGRQGRFQVEVHFATPEVRQPHEGFVTRRRFSLAP